MQENSSRTSCRHFLKMSKPYEYIKTSFFFSSLIFRLLDAPSWGQPHNQRQCYPEQPRKSCQGSLDLRQLSHSHGVFQSCLLFYFWTLTYFINYYLKEVCTFWKVWKNLGNENWFLKLGISQRKCKNIHHS